MSWSPFGDKPAAWLGPAIALIMASVGITQLIGGIILIREVSPYNLLGCFGGLVMCVFGAIVGFLGAALLYYLIQDWRRGR